MAESLIAGALAGLVPGDDIICQLIDAQVELAAVPVPWRVSQLANVNRETARFPERT